MAKIHQYPIEQLTFENDDFFDVDHFDSNTSTFQSRKIKGSTIKNGIELLLKPATITIELIEELTVDFYAPNDLKINSTTIISGSGTVDLFVNDVSYIFGDVILQGSKITTTGSSNLVVNLNSVYE
jgi:hypothetical protein